MVYSSFAIMHRRKYRDREIVKRGKTKVWETLFITRKMYFNWKSIVSNDLMHDRILYARFWKNVNFRKKINIFHDREIEIRKRSLTISRKC